jgi:putative transposase
MKGVLVMQNIFNKKAKEDFDNANSLSHSKWNCKYHIIFAPKYRRKIFYGQKRLEIGKILRELCEWNGVKIIEAEVCPDHVHMFVEIPPKLAVSKLMGILKGKSSLIIFQRWSNLKYKFGQRSFWCRGYYVDTVGKNAKKIAEYVKNQMKEDMMTDQITIKEYKDPFNG